MEFNGDGQGRGGEHCITCYECGEPIEGWMNTRTFGEWDADEQNYRSPPGIRNHYCEECWREDFGRANGAHLEPTSARQLYDVLDAANGDLAAVLTWWSGRPAIRVVDGEIEAAVTKPRDGGETEDGTPIVNFESELIEGFDREKFNEIADPPEEMNLVLLLKPERTPFHGVDGGEEVAE